jgi:DNA-directed RNA polymerase subunit M/transcription elongation factor TFIIS
MSEENEEDFDKLEEIILEEEKKSHPKKVLICPECNSNEVMYYLGGNIGYLYECKKCGYIGAFVIEG